jgi:hypothetical protein
MISIEQIAPTFIEDLISNTTSPDSEQKKGLIDFRPFENNADPSFSQLGF